MLLRRLTLLASIGSLIVSLWLLSVIAFIPPRVNADHIMFWTIVMIGFFAFGAASLYVVRYSGIPTVVRISLGFAAGVAILLGGLVVFQNELQARKTGDWEAYISLMGIVLAGHGLLLLLYLLRSRKQASSPPVK